MENKKLLIRIKDLKQYFPLKKKGLYVKANDGITLDIYEDEIFGLVGESGCGKSTLGRVILQLYHQTDGKTLYYGRTLAEVAPEYVKNTLKTLEKDREGLKKLKDLRDKAYNDFVKLYGSEIEDTNKLDIADDRKDKKNIYEKLQELRASEKKLNDSYLNIVGIIGGFFIEKDLTPIIKVLQERCQLWEENVKVMEELKKLNLTLTELQYKKEKKCSSGKSQDSINNKIKAIEKKISVKNQEKNSITEKLKNSEDRISEMKKAYEGNAEFQKHEAFLDEGIDLARLKYNEMRKLRRDLQLIFQDPYSSLDARMTVGQIIGEGLKAHGLYRKDDSRMQEYIMKVMEECGLAPYMVHRYPHQFSGGQRQRIGIARSLALRPKFIVCDEAVSALDVSIQSQIINLLLDLKEQGHLTYMFISHDLSVVKYISDRIAVMYLGNLVEMASTEDLFKAPRHPYTEALLSAIPSTEVEHNKDTDVPLLEGDIPSPINPPKGCKFHTRCRYATDICREIIPLMEEVGQGHFVACHHKLEGIEA